jgi:hypothetical protein
MSFKFPTDPGGDTVRWMAFYVIVAVAFWVAFIWAIHRSVWP